MFISELPRDLSLAGRITGLFCEIPQEGGGGKPIFQLLTDFDSAEWQTFRRLCRQLQISPLYVCEQPLSCLVGDCRRIRPHGASTFPLLVAALVFGQTAPI